MRLIKSQDSALFCFVKGNGSLQPSSFLPSRLVSFPLIYHEEEKTEAAFCLLVSIKQFEITTLKLFNFAERDCTLEWGLLPLGDSVSTRIEDDVNS